MKRLLFVPIVVLLGCAPSNVSQKEPTPFVVGEQRVIVTGCEKLKKEVEQWNKDNPDKQPKKADC